MYLKKMFYLLILLSLIILTGCKNKIRSLEDIRNDGKITVVTNAVFPPFEYYKFNNIEGIDIDIAKEIAKDLNVDLEILEMNFDGVVSAIASGKGDFVASGLTVDKKKEKAISFSDSYITVPQSLIVMKSNKVDSKLDALKDKRVGAQIGTTSDKNVRKEIETGFLKDSLSTIVEKKDFLDLVVDLRNNRLDVIALDGFIARKLVDKNDDIRYFDIETEDYALAVKKGNEELLREINKTIRKLVTSNKIEEFYHRHYN